MNVFFVIEQKKNLFIQVILLYVVRDNKFPVTKHHTLIATHRHVSDFFDLNNDELNDLS